MLYKRGVLHWKLKPEQKIMYDAIYATPSNLFVINCSRRLGKSYMLCLICDEYARQVPGAQVKYAAPTRKQVREIIKPIYSKMLLGCPENFKPWWNTMDSAWVYPNGSKISIVGCDLNSIDRLRGEETDLCAIDEAGLIQEDLGYIVRDIILPQTLTVNKNKHPLAGKIIMASTPPKSPAHPFVSYIAQAEVSGLNNYIHMTIYDNSMITEELINEYAKDSGCVVENNKIVRMSTTFKREYMAEIITEETYSIIPEYESAEKDVVILYKRPPYFDAYVSMDPALIDLTAVLFGFWDFLRNKLVIEDEIVINYKDGYNTDKLARLICEKERELWGDQAPFLRVMDCNQQLCQDLNVLHGLNFTVSQKDDKEAAVNAVRLLIYSRQIEIHPRCKSLRAHLKYGIWDNKKRKFERSGDFGHFDCIDALVYMVRNLSRRRNPYPSYIPSMSTHFVSPEMYSKKSLSEEEEKLKNAIVGHIRKG